MAELVGGEEEQPFLLRLLAEVGKQSRQASDAGVFSLSVREKAAALTAIAEARRALDATHLTVVRSLAGQDLTDVGATSVAGLVASRLRVPLGRARADVAAARATDPATGPLPRMGAALVDGTVSMGHVDVAVATLDKIPTRLVREHAPRVEEFLLDASCRYRPTEVANLAREVLDRIDPDRHDRGYDPDAFTRRSFTLTTDAYGMGLPGGQLDALTAAVLKTALDHYSAPTPAQTDADGTIQLRDDRTPAQRRCDALAEIARRALATAGAGGEGGTRQGEPPRVVVHTTVEQLRDPTGTVDCEATGAVPATFVRRLFCDCLLERVLLAANGAVLNLGRAVRTATPAQRRALAARDRGCIWPGCTVPARWTDAHHVPGWVHGSPTDIAAMCLLCGAHHSQVDAGHYRVTMVDGIPHVTPPAWVDPRQAPIRNTHWLDKRAAVDLGEQLRLDLRAQQRREPPPDTG